MAACLGMLGARRADCEALAGRSTLNRLERAPVGEPTRYHKIIHDPAAIARLLVELFLGAHAAPPAEIALDLDASDLALHGDQEGRFFHGYYGHYCYLPLYVFCGEHLLVAKLRPANIDAAAGALDEVRHIVGQIRERWPDVRIILRADSGFARDDLMSWCEQNAVDYVIGLARNDRLTKRIRAELDQAAATTRKAARVFADFPWSTRKSWSRERRVIAKAEALPPIDDPHSAWIARIEAELCPQQSHLLYGLRDAAAFLEKPSVTGYLYQEGTGSPPKPVENHDQFSPPSRDGGVSFFRQMHHMKALPATINFVVSGWCLSPP